MQRSRQNCQGQSGKRVSALLYRRRISLCPDSDQRVPYSQSAHFAERLVDYIPAENIQYSLIPGADHEDPLFYNDENLDAVFAWLDTFMKG